MATTSLPPGFRFHPTDVELVVYYLKRKVLGKKLHFNAISEVDVYKNAPWDLPDKSCLKSKDLKWYFFSAREKKYASGARMNRANDYGYWKVTGKDRAVHYEDKVVGLIKTLVFHLGKPPKGNRTNWVMHEYRLEDKDLLDKGVVQDTFVLNVVFQKDGIGPRNGAQYGAPFTEEEWSDNEQNSEAVTFAGPVLLPHNQTATSHPFESICNATHSESALPDSQVYPSLPTVSVDKNHEGQDNDDMDLLLAQFTEEDLPADCETGRIEKHDDVEAPSSDFDQEDFFKDLNLPVLTDLDKVNPGGPTFSEYLSTGMFPADDSLFLELLDLESPLNPPLPGI